MKIQVVHEQATVRTQHGVIIIRGRQYCRAVNQSITTVRADSLKTQEEDI